jgi:uncharacterized protein YvpB
MNQLIENITDFVLSTNFLYPTIITLIIISILYNVSKFLKIKGILKEKVIEDKKNFFKKLLSLPYKSFFYLLKHSFIVNIVLGIILIILTAGIILPQPKITHPLDPALGFLEITPESPLKISFDRPINKNLLTYEISPPLEGDWKFSNSIAPSKLYFYPKKTPERGVRYQISMTQIKNILGGGGMNFLFSFQAPPLPEIKSFTPNDGDQGVLPGQELLFEVTEEAKQSALIEYEITPTVETEFEENIRQYKIKPKDKFKKGTTYTVLIFRTPQEYNFETKEKKATSEKQEIYKTSFKVIDAPGVASYSPTGSGVLTDSQVSVSFRQNMNKEATQSAFSITPSTSGDIDWTDDRNIIFKPSSPLTKNTKYSVKIATTAKAQDDSPFEEELNFEFTTIGFVTASISPGNGAKSASISSAISVSFNQEVDHSSAQSKFSISPNTQGSFSWKGTIMYFNHSTFGYSTNYNVTIASGVKSIKGLDSNQNFSSNFTTQQQSVTLNIPSYRQSHMYSCFAAASKMALAYRGVSVSENTLLSQIGYDTTPFSGTWKDPNAIWGNPYSGVVGNVDGASGGVTWGYGAYWTPTSRAISNYRSNEVKTGWNVQGIAQEIANGNPVIVWWVNGIWPSYVVNWKTPSGQSIRAVNGMHVQVVKGFTGTVENPVSFIVNDSGYGYPSKTFTTAAFQAKWSWFGNSAIVVR